MQSFYEMLDFIKQKPGMMLAKPSITRLESFLNGYDWAKLQAKIPKTEEETELDEFREWVQNYYECNLPTGWSEIILFYNGNDEERAFWKFFDLLEEFKRRANPLETDRGYDWGDEDEDDEAKKASLASSRPA